MLQGRTVAAPAPRVNLDQTVSTTVIVTTVIFTTFLFLDAQASLAPTHLSLLVRQLVILSDFQSLVALRDKLKREDPNYFLTQKLF